MSNRLERTVKGLILVGLALFLTNSIINGTLLFYINRRFAWLTWIATILLLLISFAYQRAAQISPQLGPHHDHYHGDRIPWVALVLTALPLLLGLLVPPRPLGAQAVGVREVNYDGVGLGNDEIALTRAAGERNILDWLQAFGVAGDPVAFAGQTAQVSGFVYRDKTFADDQFMVSRYIVSCCVADAMVLGLIVAWPHSAELALDAWVSVEGVFQPGHFEGKATPVLIADRVTSITLPDQPYLYP